MQTEERLETLAREGYDFKLGEYIGRGWNIFVKYPSGFIGFGILAGIILMVTGFIPLIGSIANIFLTPALVAGIFIVADKMAHDDHAEFADFWKGFDRILDLGMANFVGTLIVTASLIPFIVVCAIPFISNINLIDGDPSSFMDVFPFWSLILLLPAVFLTIAFSWSSLFVVFYEMDFWKALNYSRKIVTKHWLIIFAFCIILAILAGLGLAVFFVGIAVSMPVAYCSLYAAFADVTELDRNNEYSLADELIV